MDSKNTSSQNGQGPQSDVKEDLKGVPTVVELEEALSSDLKAMFQLVNWLARDKELRLHLATFMHGRLSNQAHKPDPAQTSIFSNAVKV